MTEFSTIEVTVKTFQTSVRLIVDSTSEIRTLHRLENKPATDVPDIVLSLHGLQKEIDV